MTPQQAQQITKDLKQKIHNLTFVLSVPIERRTELKAGYEKELKEVSQYLEE